MFIVDMHCDSLGAVTAEQGLVSKYNLSAEHPQLQFFAEFVPAKAEAPEARRRKLMHYLDVYISEVNRLGLNEIRSCQDINRALQSGGRSALLSVEGGGGLFADSEELNTLYRMGLRVLGMVWDTNELGTSAWDREDNGLTPAGEDMVQRCSEMGIILDVSHLSDKSLERALEISAYPVLATHSNFREVCASPRNLTLPQAKKIVARGGVIGLNLYPSFLADSPVATAEDIYAHVDYALAKLGPSALSLGCDVDGTDGQYPDGFNEQGSIHDRLLELLWRRYPESTVEAIMGGNALSFLKQNL